MTLPDWLAHVAERITHVRAEDLSAFLPPDEGGRESAVLILFGESEHDGKLLRDLLLIERSHDMRSHAGQPAFPGGAIDPTDAGPEAAAIREAVEETGLDPSGVAVFATLPALWVPPSGFVVTPVMAWWRQPSPVHAVDEAEVAAVHRVPIDELLDPANRLNVKHPIGYVGPAFRVRGMLVWGFTAGILDRLFRFVGWERPWDRSRVELLPPEVVRLAFRTYTQRGLTPPTYPPAPAPPETAPSSADEIPE